MLFLKRVHCIALELTRRDRTFALSSILLAISCAVGASLAVAQILTGPGRVVSGDMLRIAGRNLRMDGYDAPSARRPA